jgi:hypothetical protein
MVALIRYLPGKQQAHRLVTLVPSCGGTVGW